MARKIISLSIIGIIIGYLILNFVAIFYAHKLIFIPHRAGYEDAPWLIKLRSLNGKQIYLYHLKNPEAKYILLVSHGNGVDISDMLPFYHEARRHGFEVVGYDYQGYGLSEGYPSERNCYQDIFRVYSYLVDDLKIDPERIVVFGHSLGSGPSVELATTKPVAGLILQGAFTSAVRVVTRYKILAVDYFNNLKKIRNLTAPILVIHGDKDEIISIYHGKTLYKYAGDNNVFKKFLEIKDGTHSGLFLQQPKLFWNTIDEFLQKLD